MSGYQILYPIPDDADVKTVDEFREACGWGDISNEDGTGYYANPPMMDRAKPARPSDIVQGKTEPGFTHVVWFNK